MRWIVALGLLGGLAVTASGDRAVADDPDNPAERGLWAGRTTVLSGSVGGERVDHDQVLEIVGPVLPRSLPATCTEPVMLDRSSIAGFFSDETLTCRAGSLTRAGGHVEALVSCKAAPGAPGVLDTSLTVRMDSSATAVRFEEDVVIADMRASDGPISARIRARVDFRRVGDCS